MNTTCKEKLMLQIVGLLTQLTKWNCPTGAFQDDIQLAINTAENRENKAPFITVWLSFSLKSFVNLLCISPSCKSTESL